MTYDLLSDVDSAVIKKFGILNTTISADDAQTHPQTKMSFYGIPFPGVYVVDAEGIVTEKFFHRHYATRSSAGRIRDSALGEILARHEAPSAELDTEHVKVTAFLADPDLKFEYTSQLYVRLEIADGFHVYGDPLPEAISSATSSITSSTRGSSSA